MSLRSKSVLIVLSTLFIAYFLLQGLTQTVLVDSFLEVEEQAVELNLSHAFNSLDKQLQQIQITCTDYAAWNATYEYMQTRGEEYPQTNFIATSYTNNAVNLIILYDLEGQPVYSGAFDLQQSRFVDAPEELRDLSRFGSSILTRAAQGDSTAGIALLGNTPLMFAACPITNNDRTAPPRGVLLMGRNLDDRHMQEVSAALSVDITIHSLENGIPSQLNLDRSHSAIAAVVPHDEERISGYKILADWQGQPRMLLQVEMPRSIYQEGAQALKALTNWTIAAGFLIGVFILIALERAILSRIIRLSKRVHKLGHREILSIPVDRPGQDDEITALTQEINQMLTTLQHSQYQAQESWEQYRQLFNDSFTANFIAAKDGTLLLFNTAFASLFKLDGPKEALQLNLFALYPGEGQREQFIKNLQAGIPFSNQLLDLHDLEGAPLKVLTSARGIYGGAGRLHRIQGYLLDLTEQEQTQDALQYLSVHDRLTGLYNRSFVENELMRMEKEGRYPFSIIMVDVNGLKMVNDAFGHQQGDRYLKQLANILTQCCRPQDLIARWGGDEFLIVMPETEEAAALSTAICIETACRNEENESAKISISLGTGCAETHLVNFQAVISLAEERMYRNKLLQLHSNRSALIASLEKTLWEKSNETEAHAQRLARLVSQVGESMNLSQSQMDEVKLLAALHDIGKIAVPDEVLEKPGPLDPDEWEVIKKHSEIGYRIAQFSPEMAPIAEAILAHHERWDGKGYPMGLSGKDIPLIARILTIADAYDVMTHERPYKKPISHEEAIKELKAQAGHQFDPDLVHIFITSISPAGSDFQ